MIIILTLALFSDACRSLLPRLYVLMTLSKVRQVKRGAVLINGTGGALQRTRGIAYLAGYAHGN